MPAKWHNRKSVRLTDYDYSGPGAYFVTICTNNRRCILGTVEAGLVKLNKLGQMVELRWKKIPEHHPRVQLDQYIIMPNHLHGLLFFLQRNEGAAGCAPTSVLGGNPKLGSLSNVIRSFKASVSRNAGETGCCLRGHLWQRSFYEHVIRNETDMKQVREYIVTNPLRWSVDRENTEGAAYCAHPFEKATP